MAKMTDSRGSELLKQLPKPQRILKYRGFLTSLYFFGRRKRMPGTLQGDATEAELN